MCLLVLWAWLWGDFSATRNWIWMCYPLTCLSPCVLPPAGHYLVVREGLTNPWIPDNWSWGGVVSDHCPVMAEFYVDVAQKELRNRVSVVERGESMSKHERWLRLAVATEIQKEDCGTVDVISDWLDFALDWILLWPGFCSGSKGGFTWRMWIEAPRLPF